MVGDILYSTFMRERERERGGGVVARERRLFLILIN